MSIINTQAISDSRKVVTGSDGAMYDGKGKLLATVESYQSQINFANQKYRPLGTPIETEVPDAVSTTLTMTQIMVRDDEFIEGILAFQSTGKMPEWNFQGVVKGKNGSTQRMIYNYCVPTGQIDIQNISVGGIIKRTFNFAVNGGVRQQGKLTA